MAPGGDFLARLLHGDDVIDEVDYRNRAARRAWREAGREYRGEVAQVRQVPEIVLPAEPHHAPQAAGGSRSKRTSHKSRARSGIFEVVREPREKAPSRRQTVRDDRPREFRPPAQANPSPVRRETVSHRGDREKAHREEPRRPEYHMDKYAIGNYGGVSPRVTRERNDGQDPRPAPKLFEPLGEGRIGSKVSRHSSHRGAPAGIPEQLRQPAPHVSRSHHTSARGRQEEDYHGASVVEAQPRASRSRPSNH